MLDDNGLLTTGFDLLESEQASLKCINHARRRVRHPGPIDRRHVTAASANQHIAA